MKVDMYSSRVILIAAHDENRGIGNQGVIPWKIKSDMEHFADMTTDHVVVMGRKTMESLPKKHLSGRYNVVISGTVDDHDKPFTANGCPWGALRHAKLVARSFFRDVFIIGGGEIYNIFAPVATNAIITHVDGVYEADAFFPDIHDPDICGEEYGWKIDPYKTRREETENYGFTIKHYTKTKK